MPIAKKLKDIEKPFFIVKYYKNGKVIGRLGRFKKISLLLRTEIKFNAGTIDKAYLRVQYNKRAINDGFYDCIKDFRKAYEIFTSNNLIKYINDNY